jgi:iron complex outermembrane receptor protein
MPYKKGLSSVASVDFQLTGELFSMPSGPAQFALATEYAKQRFEDRRDAEVLAGNVESLGGSSGGGERKYSAFGVELGLPILETLTVSLAGRYDNYDDASQVGGAFSPRVALQYRPLRDLLVRASAGKSFRAPDLQRLFGAESAGFGELIDTPQCIADGGAGRGDENVASCVEVVQSVQVRTGANLELEEEKGDNLNFGLVWESASGLALSTDFWYIKLERIVNSFAPQFILDRNAESGAFAEFIERDTSSCAQLNNPGCLDTVISQAANLSFKRARGVDTTVRYRISTGQLGRFEFQLGSSYVAKLEIQQAALEPVIDVLRNGTLDEFVRFRGNASLGWSRGPLAGTLFLNYIGPFTPEDTTSVAKVGSFTTVNLSGAYELPWNGTIQAGINNIFNRDPPLDLSEGVGAQPFYNHDFHDALGANGWLRYTQRF